MALHSTFPVGQRAAGELNRGVGDTAVKAYWTRAQAVFPTGAHAAPSRKSSAGGWMPPQMRDRPT